MVRNLLGWERHSRQRDQQKPWPRGVKESVRKGRLRAGRNKAGIPGLLLTLWVTLGHRSPSLGFSVPI